MDYNKKQTIVRIVKRENPFLQIDKTSLKDKRLSWKAKGLLCYLISLPNDWKLYLNELQRHAKDGRDSTSSGINELIKFGYVIRNQRKDLNGKFMPTEYFVYEIPMRIVKDLGITAVQPRTDFPETVIPKTENTKLLINNNTNKTDTNNQSINHDVDSDRLRIEDFRKIVSENIELDYLQSKYQYDKNINDIYEIIVDVLKSTNGVQNINNQSVSIYEIQTVFLQLKSNHIEYVMECLNKQYDRIYNIRSYLISALYNAPKTMNIYYSNLFQYEQ